MSIYEIKGEPHEIGMAVFGFLTHVAYLRTSDSERADEITEQVMDEEVPKIGSHGFTVGSAVRMLRRVKELCEENG